MLEEHEARQLMMDVVGLGPAETVPLGEAMGAYVLHEIISREPSPLFDNSSVDGYTVTGSLETGASFVVTGEQPAGKDRDLLVMAGESIRIFTGAPVPRGAFAVAMQEDVVRRENTITLLEPLGPGENIRRRGSDFQSGELLLAKGCHIEAGVLALLASQGFEEIPVVRMPRIGILTTGDELVPVGTPRLPGMIVESNALMLEAMMRRMGWGPVLKRHAGDTVESLTEAATFLLEHCDFLLTVGGVSVGDHDLVRPVLTALGVKEEFWKIKLKPGKPLAFGTREGAGHMTFVFGLPGNPVSALVSTLAFVIPVIKSWRGCVDREPFRRVPAKLSVALVNDGDRPHYLRGFLDAQGVWSPSGLQRSDALRSLATANSLLRLSENLTLPEGSLVDALLW